MSKQRVEVEVDVPDGMEVVCVEPSGVIGFTNRSWVNFSVVLRIKPPAAVKLARDLTEYWEAPDRVIFTSGEGRRELAEQIIAEFEAKGAAP